MNVPSEFACVWKEFQDAKARMMISYRLSTELNHLQEELESNSLLD